MVKGNEHKVCGRSIGRVDILCHAGGCRVPPAGYVLIVGTLKVGPEKTILVKFRAIHSGPAWRRKGQWIGLTVSLQWKQWR